ncbi:hypothetical protein PQX77_019695 [Marasmius sp. AFHP31]|nr:hypothetical protein PQX77_019695 [Marasmius sp. AFHP31]
MVSTLSSPSTFTPDDHIQVFFKILVDFGSEQVDIEALFSNPGFENLLCSAQFEQILCRFPPWDLSDHSLSVLIHLVTNKTMLKDLYDEELIPPFVTLLANALEQTVHHVKDKNLTCRRRLLPSYHLGSFPLLESTPSRIMTTQSTFPSVHSVPLNDDSSTTACNSGTPLQYPLQSTMATQSHSAMHTPPADMFVTSRGSYTQQVHTNVKHPPLHPHPQPLINTVPNRSSSPSINSTNPFSCSTKRDIIHNLSILQSNSREDPSQPDTTIWSASPHANKSAIHPKSVSNSQHALRYTTNHMALPSRQRSEDLGIPLDEEETEHVLGDPYENDQLISDDDGASQRSDEWEIFFEDWANETIEDGDGFQSEDDVDQYGCGSNDEKSYHCLALVSQNFPRLLWSLQLPKALRNHHSPKQHLPGSEALIMFQSLFCNVLSTHLPYLVVITAFETFLQATGVLFNQTLQLSRRFVSPLEGTDIIINYREHLLLHEDDELDSEFLGEEVIVTHDAMRDIFGTGLAPSESPWHVEQGDWLNLQDPDYNTDEDIVLGDETTSWDNQQWLQGEHNLNGCLALLPQDFPSSLWSIQSPKVVTQTHDLTLDSCTINAFSYPMPALVAIKQLEPVSTTFFVTPESHLCLETSTPNTSSCLAVEYVSYSISHLSTSFKTHHGPVPTPPSRATRVFLGTFYSNPPIRWNHESRWTGMVIRESSEVVKVLDKLPVSYNCHLKVVLCLRMYRGHSSGDLRRKNEVSQGGVKTYTPRHHGPHFSLASPPDVRIQALRVKRLVDCHEIIVNSWPYDQDPSWTIPRESDERISNEAQRNKGLTKVIELPTLNRFILEWSLEVSVLSIISSQSRHCVISPSTDFHESLEKLDEEAVHDTASNQFLKTRPIEGYNSPIHSFDCPIHSRSPSYSSSSCYPFTPTSDHSQGSIEALQSFINGFSGKIQVLYLKEDGSQ